MENFNLKICPKICKECPFSNKSSSGWLGPWKVEEIMDFQQFEGLFGCHLHLTDDEEENCRKIEVGEIPICRGYIASADKSCKVFGQNPITGKSLYKLQEQITEEDKESVLSRPEFRKHHTL